MAKSKGYVLTVHTDLYSIKQKAFKTGWNLSALNDPHVREVVDSYVKMQTENYLRGFGVFNYLWTQVVAGMLAQMGVNGQIRALYRAFFNEYLKKVKGLGRNKSATETKERLIEKYKALGASEEVLNAIVDAVDKSVSGMSLF